MDHTILITGSTDGVGKLTASKLAKEGYTVIVHGRNPQKLADVVEEIKASTGNEKVLGFVADFSDLAAVQQMAVQVREKIAGLDVLINNAGVFNTSSAQNEDGWDMRFVVNYFAPYLLTNALLPVLKSSADARIINLSSAAQEQIDYDLMQGKKKVASERNAYGQSKLAILMWSFHLSTQHDDITVIPVNPGSLLDTNMVREAYGKFWSKPDKGANIVFDLATAPKYKGVSGQYFDNDQGSFGPAHPDAYKDAEIQKLLAATEALLSGK